MADSSPTRTPPTLDPEVVTAFHRDGYGIVRNLFTQSECDRFAEYFTTMVERGGDGYAESPVDTGHPDPLKRYPRLLQPHRRDAVAFAYMTDARLRAALTAVLEAEPYAVQTMVYFKPPQARGQNLHQDNMYLLAAPGTCVAAWLALDDCDEENGCLVFCPGTAALPVVCQTATPTGVDSEHWDTLATPRPPGAPAPVPATMTRGDVVLFNGSVVHGSFKNRSASRFRRCLIAHYVAAEATQVAKYYFPVYAMDGAVVEGFAESAPGGPCGVYAENGAVAMSGSFTAWQRAH